jgi:hypothetical protein
MRRYKRIAILKTRSILFAMVAVFFLPGTYSAVAEEKKELATDIPAASVTVEERWGIKPLAIRLTAAGHMLDFRYHVVDAEKATPFFKPQIKPYLIDEASGAVMAVPNVPKVGSMRSTRKPLKDRGYAILFANPQKHIKPGNKVTVVIGDIKVEHLVVE